MSDAARLRRARRAGADNRRPRARAQGQARVRRRRAVKAAFAQNLAEAQLIQGILLEQGIPSIERRSRGFDVPDFLAAGPRDILVPHSGYEAARELLADSRGPEPAAAADEQPARLALWILVALIAAVAIVWLLYQAAT